MRYPLGQPIVLTTTLTAQATGLLTNDSTLSLTIQNPDLTTQVFPSPTNSSTGVYYQDIPAADLTQFGHYQYVWTATSTCAGVSRGEFEVFDPFEPVVLALQDAKNILNIPQTTTTYDTRIQAYIDTIVSQIEVVTGGPLYNQIVTERVPISSDYRALVLRQRPLQATADYAYGIVSIVDIASGVAMSLTEMQIEVDMNAGIIRRLRQWPFIYWGLSGYQVTYVAGWGTILPPAFNMAAQLTLQYLWEAQMGPGIRPNVGTAGEDIPSAEVGFVIPPRAMAMLRPFQQDVYV